MDNIDNNEISMEYNIEDETRIKIFGNTFVKNNKNKCKIVFENKEYDLIEHFNIKKYSKEKYDKLNLKLRYINNITDMSCLFSGCVSLLSLPDISKWNTFNIKNMEDIFYYCKSLKYLPDISKWDTSNVEDMAFMFEI